MSSLLSFFALGEKTAAVLPPPFPNPDKISRHWYHGTSHEYHNDELAHPDPDADPHEVRPGGTIRSREPYASEYGENSENHWNTDLGTHFASSHEMAHRFAAQGGAVPSSRIAHCALHMANPKHYPSEFDMTHEAIGWAHKNGFKYRVAPEDEDAFHCGALEDYATDEEEHYRHQPIIEHGDHSDRHNVLALEHSDHEAHHVDHEDWDMIARSGAGDNYLRYHPDREEISAGFKRHLQDQGHDGVTYGNEYEHPIGSKCAIAFDDDHIHLKRWEWLHEKSHHLNVPGTSVDERHAHDPDQLQAVEPNYTPEHGYHWRGPDDEHLGPMHSALMTHFGMGANGPDYKGLIFDVQPSNHPSLPESYELRATHPQHGPVGHIIFTPHDHEIPTGIDDDNTTHFEIEALEVPGKHRRRGVGSALMSHLDSWGLPIDHGGRTNDGRAWAHSHYGPHPPDATLNGREHIFALLQHFGAAPQKPEYEPVPEGASDDESMAHWDSERQKKNAWQRDIRGGLSLGKYTPTEARKAGYWGSGHDQSEQGWDTEGEENFHHGLGWKPLPHTLWHVTTHKDDVLRDGLKSRDDLAQEKGKGLGGGESDTISFTEDPDLAHHIHRALHEYHYVLNRPIGHALAGMHEEAKRMGFAHTVMSSQYGGDRKPGDPDPVDYTHHLRGREVEHIGPHTIEEARAKFHPEAEPADEGWDAPRGRIHMQFSRPMTEQEQTERVSSHYKAHSWMRAHYGGPPDPLFTGNDIAGFKDMDPSQFAVLKVHPTPGARGYKLGGMSEWRTAHPGAVQVAGVDEEHQHKMAALSDRDGLCYEHAYRYLKDHPDATLVHGATHGGMIKHHAWVEDGEHVYEPTYDTSFTKAGHEQVFRPQPEARYSYEDAMTSMLQAGHYGPWHQHKTAAKRPPDEVGTVPVDQWAPPSGPVNAYTPTGECLGCPSPERHQEKLDSIRQFWAGGGVAPVEVLVHSDGGMSLAQGAHRMEVAREQGITHLPAEFRHLKGDTSWRLHAGLNGDLPEGLEYTVHYRHPEHPRIKMREGEAWAFVHHQGKSIGGLRWNYHEDPPTVQDMSVSEDYQRRGVGTALFNWVKGNHESGLQHSDVLSDDAKGWIQSLSAHVLDPWEPKERLFAPTKGDVDPRLFDAQRTMLVPIRDEVLEDVGEFFTSHGYGDMRSGWARVYLAGSQASEWYGNNDFDILVGINYPMFRLSHPDLAGLSNDQIDHQINLAFFKDFNDEQWHPRFDPDHEWHRTGYVNKDSWDIRDIKPYAAYNVTDDTWAVDPIHEPTGHQFGPTEWYYFEAVAEEARRALALPEPRRHQRAAQVWTFIHTDRSRAFGPHGTGAFDRGNALEKYLDQAPSGIEGKSLMAALADARFGVSA